MRHGIAISERDRAEMLSFLTVARADCEQVPPVWGEWSTASDTDGDDTESFVGSESSDEEGEYRPFSQLPPNPDGRRCRCGSTTHMTVSSFACPLNPRNNAVNDAGDNDAGESESESDDNDRNNAVNDAGDNDAGESESDDNDPPATRHDAGDNDPPVTRRLRLGLPTRRRRQIVGTENNIVESPVSCRRRIDNDTDEPQEIKIGTKVQSTGTRWKLPESTIFQGKVISKRKYRGVLTFKVRWEDGVVEYLKKEHILPMCVFL